MHIFNIKKQFKKNDNSKQINASFDELYTRYAGLVYSRCVNALGNPEQAKDLVHDVFLKALKKYYMYRNDAQIHSWLYSITTNMIIDTIRKKMTRNKYFEEFDENRYLYPTKSQEPITTISIRMLLEKLPKRLQKIAYLHIVEQSTQEECAEILHVSRKTIQRDLRKIKCHFSTIRRESTHE